MTPTAILAPMFALAAWTFVVLICILIARINSSRRGETTVGDFRLGESARVPAAVSIPNRNYMNLLELPVLFYVVCLITFAAHGATSVMVSLGWTYVALRIMHSLVHLTYNNVFHRLGAFAASNVVLIVLWLMAAQSLFFAG